MHQTIDERDSYIKKSNELTAENFMCNQTIERRNETIMQNRMTIEQRTREYQEEFE